MKWLHTLGSIGLVVVTILAPQLQNTIASHPQIAASLAAAWGLLGQILPHADPTAGLTQTQTVAKSQSH